MLKGIGVGCFPRFPMQLDRHCTLSNASFHFYHILISGVVLHETSVLPDHAQEETLHIKVMESELRRLKNEVNTLLNDLKQTETLTEELTDRCRAAEETKEHIAGRICVWCFLCKLFVLLCLLLGRLD